MEDNAIDTLVRGYNANPQADSTMRAFLTQCVKNGLTVEETAALTLAMAGTGRQLDWQAAELSGRVSVDLPSTGGIGNKTPILAPLLALAAAPEKIFVPKMSSRGRVAGTIDILESVGYQGDLPYSAYQKIVSRIGIANVAQTQDLAPVDSPMMALRKEVGAMDQAHLVVSSVLCKKLATGCRNIIIDVKAGPDSKFGDLNQTLAGAHLFIDVGKLLRERGYLNRIRAVITNNYELQGLAHGRLVALQEVMDVLQGRGPQDLTDLSVGLAARLLVTAGVHGTLPDAAAIVRESLRDSRAYTKFVEYMEAHGADLRRLAHRSRYQLPVRARAGGKIWDIDVRLIDDRCRELQAVEGGQFTSGIVLGDLIRGGAVVVPGDLLATVHAEDRERGEEIAKRLQEAFPLYRGSLEIMPKPLILAECWLEDDEIHEEVSWKRLSQSALGLISREQNGRREYLFRYNRKWGAWSFLAGHFEPAADRDLQETMIREFVEEVGEEVGERSPVHGRDFTVDPMEPPTLIDLSFSGSAKEWTKYEFHLFRVRLQGEARDWQGLWRRHPEMFRWFRLSELVSGVSADGQAALAPFPLGSLLPLLA